MNEKIIKQLKSLLGVPVKCAVDGNTRTLLSTDSNKFTVRTVPPDEYGGDRYEFTETTDSSGTQFRFLCYQKRIHID